MFYRKVIRTFFSIVIISVFFALNTGLTFADTCADESTKEGLFEEELKIINQRIEYEMLYEGDEKEQKISETENDMTELGIEIWNIYDVAEFLEQSDNSQQADAILNLWGVNENICKTYNDLPVPPSNDKIQFYAVRKMVDGTWVYSVIAAPVANANHSCNTVKRITDMKDKLTTLKSVIQIYTNKAIGAIPVLNWIPYEVFTDLLFSNTSKSQLATYECTMTTRTVHQFIYVENSMGQYSYYGSANCVHVNIENIARRYVGSRLETSVYNDYKLDTAPDYYNWAKVCTDGNLTGYGVTRKYSFIQAVSIKVDENTVLTQYIVNARLPIQVTT